MPAANRHVTTFHTPTDTQVVVRRVVDAPRDLVFEVHTSCHHLPHWMGPYGWTMSECLIELRPGGAIRYTWTRPEGGGITITGVVKEVVRPELLVSTESWGPPWPEAMNRLEFSEADGQTTMVMTITYPSKEARDQALQTGMKDGMTVGYERLERYIASLEL
ncbi:MAG: SRPBCC domain-containing protein [Gemmatimonadaceae bacterium]|nr:SRPBCC domain-containing protein [Gemmatimonadaceae bacterium]